jgi:hypothetical protein
MSEIHVYYVSRLSYCRSTPCTWSSMTRSSTDLFALKRVNVDIGGSSIEFQIVIPALNFDVNYPNLILRTIH